MKSLQTLSICALLTMMAATSIATAQQALSGTVTGIDELRGTISIERTSSDTTGSSSGGSTESYKVQDGLLFNAVHVGDRVSFSVDTLDGAKTITRLDTK